MQITIESQITDVTVYNFQALVTRTASVKLTGQEKELIFGDLPSTIEPNSIRVSTVVTDPIKVMSVRTEKIFDTRSTSNSLTKVDRTITHLQNQIKIKNQQLNSLKNLRESLKFLNDKSIEGYAFRLSRKESDHISNIKNLLDFIELKYDEYNGQIIAIENKIQNLEKQILFLQQQRQQFLETDTPQNLNIIAVIEAKTEMEYQIEVSYLIRGAYWNPLYDFTAETNSNLLKLTYLAEVKQSTGEDWSNVNLTLSTAKPALGFIPPKPEPWYLNLFNNYTMARMEMGSGIDTAITSTRAQGNNEGSFDTKAVANVEKTGSIINFRIEGKSNISSNGNPHKIMVFEDRYSYKLQHIAIPYLVSFAYLQAKIHNPQFGVTLLRGKANIFRDSVFVGTNEIDNIAPGQDFDLNLGIDESLKIERSLAEHQTDKTLISNKKRITYAYRISVTNLVDHEKSLKLIEQLPVSRHEQLKVSLNQFNPKTDQKEMGILEWNLVILPNAKREIYYQFAVECPPDYTVLGLEDRA
jgi:uncharacterized protein (TIGR02231 family)